MSSGNFKKVAFGGGCFWCTEVIFLNLKGVISVTPGYAGGSMVNPTYEEVSRGNTGHAEVILVEYDENIINFNTLLMVFFDSHNPTSLNRQGNDYGTEYRSIILFSNEDQKKEAIDYIQKISNEKKYQSRVLTELKPLSVFYPAEEYHKQYYEKHPNEGYSVFIIKPKIEKIQNKYPDLLK